MSRPQAPTILDIADYLGARDQLAGLDEACDSTAILRPAPIDQAHEGDIAFIDLSSARARELLTATSATLVLLAHEPASSRARPSRPVTLSCPNPRLAFIRVLGRFFAPERPTGIHPRAVVEGGASVPASAYVGPLATIGEGVSIGERTVIHAGVHVYPACTIGVDCTIHSGAVIGADGFGYERNEQGAPERFPHVGTVVIEDDVEIGANTCIDRGSLGATLIRSHARVDDMVYIAHNVEVGRGAMIVAMTMVAGGVRLGDHAYLAPSSALDDHVSIGQAATVGLGAVVRRDVPARATVAGNPARGLAELKAINAALRELMR